MYTLFLIIIILIVSFITFVLVFRKKVDFYITGLNYGFTISDLRLLWETAISCELEDAKTLFWSRASLEKCISKLSNANKDNGEAGDKNSSDKDSAKNSKSDKEIAKANKANAKINSKNNLEKNQRLLAKLYDYLTKLQNQTDDKKGLESTLYLDKGQKLRIILPGQGVFSSKILNNGKELIISVPRRNDMILLPAEQWIGKIISIYLWRQSDARYVFDTTVISSGLFIGEPSLSIQHSSNLIRTQKRRAVRSKCQIMANLYVIKQGTTNITSVETQPGYKCRIEDISESGASIRIGGKGVPNMQIKLQFTIQSLIIMCGIIKTVEYNEVQNESLLHFECTWTEPQMKNEIFAYVYKMLPEKEKEVYEAMSMTDADEQSDTNKTITLSKALTERSIVDDEKITLEDSELNRNATGQLDSKYNEHFEYPEYEEDYFSKTKKDNL